jgi:predicted phosphate transport protein (TIGR00153 family)
MRFFAIPKEEKFFEMFMQSSSVVLKGAKVFKEIMDDFTDVEEKVKKLSQIEKEGDSNTHGVVDALNRSFITPIDREDIYKLNSILDDILDYIEACATRLLLFKIKKTNAGMKRFAALIYQAVEELHQAISYFPKSPKILDIVRDIKDLESEGDILSHKLIAQLFEEEKDLFELIKLKEIYGRLESTLDRCQDLACLLEAIIVKNG